MIHCKTLNKEFSTKKEMLKELKSNLNKIIELKKVARESDNVNVSLKVSTASKAEPKELEIGDVVKSIINTTNVIDSHDDCHIPGIWTKSVNEQQGRIYHVINHELELGSVVAYPEDVSISVKEYRWSQLGYNYNGNTQALVFESKMTEDTVKAAFSAYKNNRPVQHSIRMKYIQLFACFNDPEYKEEYANWQKYYPQVANKEVADELGYFFAITEAAIVKEGSTVLFGSNEYTPQLVGKNIEPLENTQPKDERADESHIVTHESKKQIPIHKFY